MHLTLSTLTPSRIKSLIFLCLAAAALHPAPAAAQTVVTINLGQSAQNYVLTGTGASTSDGSTYGNYYNTQGSCVTSGSTTTCDLTGNFTSSDSTFASGTYDFQTVFTGSITTAATSQSKYPVNSQEPNDFQYSGFAASTTMTLKLVVTGGGTYAIPLVANRNFSPGLDTFNFVYVNAVCGGTSLGSDPCQQDYVGTVAGATYSGNITGAVLIDLPLPPTISPGTGTYSTAQTVTLTAPTSGTTIYYTTNGSTPTASSTPYTAPLTVSATETINAVAIYTDGIASPISTATLTFSTPENPTPAPTFYPFAGTYTSAQSVTLTDTAAGAAIYYTTDGSTPTTSSTPYTTPISISASETLKAIALASGDTTSSVATAAYSIISNPLSENGDWEWVGGPETDSAVAPLGIYGTMGTAASSNQPGGRSGASTWVDASGNFWMFGGLGADSTVGETYLEDLWKYNPSANQWTWVFGNNNATNTAADQGSYGTMGTASATNAPPEAQEAATWTDHLGNLWMYGGLGLQAATTDTDVPLSALWEFSPTTGQWTWISGQNNTPSFVAPVYGTKGTAAAGNTPGSRYSAASWVDEQGNLWLFGGTGANSSSSKGQLNDLWEYNISSGQWTWIGGSATYNQAGTYGTLGTAAAGNIPASRSNATTWTDGEGNFWLFGGDFTSGSNTTQLNDLWKYSPTSNQWTWVSGSNSTSGTQSGSIIGVATTSTQPGSREQASGWTDSYGNFWLFGGTGVDIAGTDGNLNDLWFYNVSKNTWTLAAGSTTVPAGNPTVGAPGVYGTKGTAAQGNTPGGRNTSMAWADKSGDLWLFGGAGADSTGTSFHELNDLWEFHFSAIGAAVAPTVTVTPASTSINGTSSLSVQITVSGTSGTPTGNVTLTSGTYTSAATSLASGVVTITIPASSLASGSDILTATYNPNGASSSTYTTATGTATVSVTASSTAVAPTVTVTPASSSITNTQTLSVTVTVAGNEACLAARPHLTLHPRACGTNIPGTGSIVLSSGSYTSAATTLNTSGSATLTIPAGVLASGSDTLTATYTPDSNSSSFFTSATGTNTVTVTTAVTAVAPTVTVTPASTSITTAQSLSVTIGVAGNACTPQAKPSSGHTLTPNGCGIATPTGSIVLKSGSYTSASATLSSGSATLTIPANALATGTDTLTATYTPDSNSTSIYTAATGTASVAVTTAVTTIAPTVTVTPASNALTAAASLSVTIAVSGGTPCLLQQQTTPHPNVTCGNSAVPTGSVVITSGSYTSAATTLSNGSATITIPAGSLATAADTLTATYTPDTTSSSIYSTATGTASVTVTAPPSFTLASTTPSATITSTITTATYQLVVTPQNGSFTSPVSFTATGLPTGYTASFSPTTVTPNGSPANTTMTIQSGTTLTGMLRIATAPTLALLGFLLWPAKRRRRLYLSLVAVLSIASLATLTGCGGGFSFIPAAKTYTITVTATGAAETQSTTVQLTVQQ